MTITGTTFGTITIDGETYEHDVVVHLSGAVTKRRKKLSKKIYGTSHTISEEEIRDVYEKGCTRLIVGTGQYGRAQLSPEALDYLKGKDCAVVAEPTPEAIQTFNDALHEKKKAVGLFHVTC